MESLNEDKIRYWSHVRRVGDLRENIPIQSKLALLVTKSKKDVSLSELCHIHVYNKSEFLDSNKILPPNRDDTESLQSTIDLSLSSIGSNDAVSKVKVPPNLWNAANTDVQSTEISYFEVNSINLDSISDKNQNKAFASSSSKKSLNRFESAHDKFTKEGGKLEITSSTTSKSCPKTSNDTLLIKNEKGEKELPPDLQHLEAHLVEKIESDIIHSGQPVLFDEIAGLEFAKKCVQEIIVWPMSRPDLFIGLRSLPKGLLLFGPPGTGKTLIGKAISYQIGATFFSLSSSSLTSKWIGEGEKTVKTLFAVANCRSPSIIFIDEVDSLLCQRSSDENEASRRMKTEFLVQIDGAGTNNASRVVLIGATNRPYELDDAVRRRFVKRLYIPLPDDSSRRQLFVNLLNSNSHELNASDIDWLVNQTQGYSGADIRSLATEAAMGPVRDLSNRGIKLATINACDLPAINRSHFECAFESVKSTVTPTDLQKYIDWNTEFGSYRRMD